MSTTGTVQSEYAKRQLERMGWKEGNGLGKDRQGRAAPIIVKQRPDVTGGLGIEKEKVRQVQHTIQDEWWKDALGDTLSKLCDRKEKKKKKKRKRDTDSKNSDEGTSTETKKKKIFTDEELFIATGGARFGMRAGKTRNQAKWRRTGEVETNMVVQQQQEHQMQQNNVDIVTESETTSIVGVEDQTTPQLKIYDIEAKPIQCDDLPNKKNKSMRSQVRKEKKKREEKIDSTLKTNQNEQMVVVTEHALVDASNTDTTISTSPLLEENQKKKKKKKKKKQLSIVE